MKLNNKLYNYYIEQERAKKEIKKSKAITFDFIEWMKKANEK